MGCGDERSVWDRGAVGRSGRGENTLLDPKMITAMETFKCKQDSLLIKGAIGALRDKYPFPLETTIEQRGLIFTYRAAVVRNRSTGEIVAEVTMKDEGLIFIKRVAVAKAKDSGDEISKTFEAPRVSSSHSTPPIPLIVTLEPRPTGPRTSRRVSSPLSGLPKRPEPTMKTKARPSPVSRTRASCFQRRWREPTRSSRGRVPRSRLAYRMPDPGAS